MRSTKETKKKHIEAKTFHVNESKKIKIINKIEENQRDELPKTMCVLSYDSKRVSLNQHSTPSSIVCVIH